MNDIYISHETFEEVLNLLKKTDRAFGEDRSDLFSFITRLWNLHTMPSEDDRFDNAFYDFQQHIVYNDDWEFDYIFYNRLKVFSNKNLYQKFIESVVSPIFDKDKLLIESLVSVINPILKRSGIRLVITDYNVSGVPIYSIRHHSEKNNLPIDVKENDIPFYLINDVKRNVSVLNNKYLFSDNRYFVLVENGNWNDYGYITTYHLYFYSLNKESLNIGETKIMKDDSSKKNTSIPEKFTALGNDYCSLGQSVEFYKRLYDLLGMDFESVMYALKDAAIFTSIQEKFEKKEKFIDSLIRYDDAERILREIKFDIKDNLSKKMYSFQFRFQPLYSTESVNVDFDFESELNPPNRIYAIIGKNGTGKTQLITSLPVKISEKSETDFIKGIPIFSKVIAVSYSIFDRFVLPRKTAHFNYVYCGLRDEEGVFTTEENLVTRFYKTWDKIVYHSRVDQWRKILTTFIEENIINEFLKEKDDLFQTRNSYAVDHVGFKSVRNKLSSGQSITLFIISEIVANIRLDSLLIYDEPETHLHPNAITQLMNSIYELANEFESYCIIATHSPLIVRELLSRSVYVLEREENIPSIRRISLESFGENLTTITDEVFGNKEIPKQSRIIIERLIEEGKDFDDIVGLLEYDEVPLSLNTRILIKSLLKDRR